MDQELLSSPDIMGCVLNRYRAPQAEHVRFWLDAAVRYKNHPAVLFDILNEPHGTSWEVSLHGGFVPERTTAADEDNFDADAAQSRRGFESVDMQALVDEVRGTGARNIIVVGGLDLTYDLSGILEGFAVEEHKHGNGIIYSTHVYPWKTGWQKRFLDVAKLHPILVGEVGADERKVDFIPAEAQEDAATWVPAMLGLIQQHQLNWTAWCFHPSAAPRMLVDWEYTPTPFWGQHVKEALSGKTFKLDKLR